jgi:Multisubunit Na+/H+ antiporter, MnhE subunit
LFVALLIFFTLSAGSLRFYTIALGIVVSTFTTLLLEKIVLKRILELHDILKLVHIFNYILYFVKAEISAHVELVKIILLGKQVKPAIVAVPYRVESDYGITLMALSITNTPGTVVLNVDTNSKTMYVHWINAKTFHSEEAKKRISEGFEN